MQTIDGASSGRESCKRAELVAMDLNHLADLAKSAAERGGRELKELESDEKGTIADAAHDLKSEVDLRANRAIKEILATSGLPIISEEDPHTHVSQNETMYWVIDPLDGTINYLRGGPLCCVSIALWKGLEPIFGCIYDFNSNSLYFGGKNYPSECNTQSIVVSEKATPKESIISTGFPNQRNYQNDSLLAFVKKVQQFKKVRLLGSAALFLAWLSRGWVDAYTEEGIYFWDIAAGLAIAIGSGATYSMSQIDEESQKLTIAVCSTNTLLDSLK